MAGLAAQGFQVEFGKTACLHGVNSECGGVSEELKHRSSTYWIRMVKCNRKSAVDGSPVTLTETAEFRKISPRAQMLPTPRNQLTLRSAKRASEEGTDRARCNRSLAARSHAHPVPSLVPIVSLKVRKKDQHWRNQTEDAQEEGQDIVSFDVGFLGYNSAAEKTAPYLCMVDNVSGAVFAVLTSKAVTENVIKAMVASVANWSRTAVILRSDGEPLCKSIQRKSWEILQNSPVGSHVRNGVCERMIQEVTGLVRCVGCPICRHGCSRGSI